MAKINNKIQSDIKQILLNKKCQISISRDNLTAYLAIMFPDNDEKPYTIDEIIEELNNQGIVYGINKDMINNMISSRIYDETYIIATGVPAVDEEDGRFEFYFNRDVKKVPKLNEDGSVDYLNMTLFERVVKGQKIVEYIPPTEGKDGVNIFGKPIFHKKGRELPAIRGKGFEIENNIYISKLNGKIEYSLGKIEISELYEVKGDADFASTGNIIFKGDVYIRGNVYGGIKIVAGKSVIIDGHVEDVTIIAGKDILLRNGIQGDNKAYLKAGGEINGKFFEQTDIMAVEDIKASSIMNCNLDCYGSVYVLGKNASIIGGENWVLQHIGATNIGNPALKFTRISLGISLEKADLMEELVNSIEESKNIIKRINEEILKTNDDEQKLNELKSLKVDESQKLHISRKQYNRLCIGYNNGYDSNIVVEKKLFGGVYIEFGIKDFKSIRTYNNVRIKSINEEIVVEENYM